MLFAENKVLPGNALVEQAARRFWKKAASPDERKQKRGSIASAGTVISFSDMFRDVAGETFVPVVAASSLSRLANVPVYILLETHVGGDAVGGKGPL